MKNNLTKNPRSSGCESVHFFRLFRQTARLAHGPSGFRFPTLLSLFVIFVIWILLASEGVSGNPVVVTSNLGPNDTSSGFLGGFAQEAVLFTIPLGSLPINVTSIETPVTGFSSGLTLSVGIADTGHNSVFGFRIPGNILEAANQFVPQGGSSGQGTASMLVKFDLSGNTVLQPGQDYWVVWEVTPLPVASGPFRLYESPFEPDARFVRGYMSTDPDDWITCNCAPHHNPAFRVNGIISQLDLVANTLTWDAIARQVNFSYNVNGGSLPVATTTAFYWGTGPTWADVLPGSQPIYTTPIAPGSIGNSGPLFVDAAALGVPQAGATHLILVLDPPSANSPNGLINETNKGNNVQAMQICSVGNVTRLPQSTNPIDHWGNEQYAFHDPTDPKGYTIGVWGCALTSLCMVLNSINVNVVSEPDGTLVPNDPGYLNDFMKNHPGSYSAINDVVFESAVGFLNYELNLSLNFNSYLNGVDVNGSSKVSDLLDVLCAGHAVIVHVPPAGNPFSPTFGHYVVVTGFGVDNGILNLLIADPSSRNYQALSDFGMFQIRGWVEDLNPPGGASGKAVNSASSAVDLSQANFFAGDNVDVLVTDPNGLRTGFDPISGQVLKEIPDSSYSRDFFVNDPNGDIVTAITHLVHIFHPRQGSYQVVVTGLSPGSFDLSLGAFNQDGTPHPLVSFQGFADIGSTASFSFPLVVATNNPPVCHAGGPYTVECQGSTTTLQIDGSGSSDPDGDAFTYSWASDCPGASFDDPTAAQPMLTVDSSTIPVNCNVTLTVTDSNGLSSSCTTTVTIVDTTPPIITLNGANPLSIACQSTFTDPGATAFDISAGSISVITSGTVDVNTPGNYTLRYTATDPSGNTAVATRIVSVSCNNQASGTPLVWGEGSFGQLGDGNFYSSPNFGVATAVQVSGLNGAVAIAGGDSHSVALKADGTVWAWGEGFFGQLGNGSFSNSATPVQVGALSGVAAVASGSGCLHSLALKVDGTAWAWGNGRYGQLGDGNFYTGGNSGVAVPVQVSGLVNVRALAGGFQHSVALKADGTVWAWGDGILGQLGDGNFYTGGNSGVAVPVQVSGLTGAVAISGGFWHSVALKTDGTVWAWGDGQSGQLGDCNFRSHATPVQVSAISGAVAIAAGGRHSLALKSDGTVWAWGDGTSGQLGNGTSQGSCTPVQVSNLSGVVAIAGGAKHNLALKTDGTVWSWGDGYYGELGDGNFYRSGYRGTATPVLANSLAQPVRGIACGGSHSLALPAAANTPLAITCPSDTSVNNDPGQCSAAVNYPIPITSGGSGNVTVVCNPPSGSNFPVGTNIVSCTATDSAGNAATCSFKVTVQDREPPVLVCPPDVTVNTDPGQCGAAASNVILGTPSVSDNCGVASVVVRTRIRFPVGTTAVTWTAVDTSGNVAQCTQQVTVVDAAPPVITLVGANPLIVECHTAFTDPGATADDICAGAVAVTSSGNVDVNTPSSYTITYSATDPSGNTATATRTINVVDSLAPVIALNGANPLIVPCQMPFTDPGATATDACASSVSVSASGTVDVNTPGDYTLTYSATDPSGNTANVTRTVTVVCGTPTLTITCPPDVNVANDPGQCSAVANYPAPVVSGGIGNVIVVCNPPSGSSFQVGTNVVSCTATDSAGNTATCSFNLVVKDTEPPVPSMVTTAPAVRYQNPSRVVKRGQLFANDNCDPDPLIYIGGSQSPGFVAGPFHRGDKVTLVRGLSLTPGSRQPRNPSIAAEITLNGDALIWATDSAGNVSPKSR